MPRTEGHRVIDSGLYRVVRHPAALGVIAAHLGFARVSAQRDFEQLAIRDAEALANADRFNAG